MPFQLLRLWLLYVSFHTANRLHLYQNDSWQCIPSVVILIQLNPFFSLSFLLSAILDHGLFNGYLCSFLLTVDVGVYCRKWIESQSDVCVRPREFISLLWPIVSPETKEAIDKGIEKIEEIPKFYLDAEKKEKKEKDKHKEYWLWHCGNSLERRNRTNPSTTNHTKRRRKRSKRNDPLCPMFVE